VQFPLKFTTISAVELVESALDTMPPGNEAVMAVPICAVVELPAIVTELSLLEVWLYADAPTITSLDGLGVPMSTPLKVNDDLVLTIDVAPIHVSVGKVDAAEVAPTSRVANIRRLQPVRRKLLCQPSTTQ
jgi:hypothetical protein